MPDFRNCRRCNKVYNYMGGMPLCPACKEADEADFKRLKEYLYKNPGASISLVANELEMSVSKIKAYLKDGRLEIIGDEGNFFLECERCGKAIRTGRYCDLCAKEVTSQISSTAKEMNSTLARPEDDNSAKKGIGMRYLNKDK